MAYKPDKHGRDHCIGGEDPIPCLGVQIFRAVYFDSTGITGISGTNKNLDFKWWENGNPAIFNPLGTLANDDIVNGTDLMRYVDLLKPGRYTFSVRLRPQDSFTGFKLSLNEQPEDNPFGFAEDHYAGPNDGTYSTTGWLAWTWVNTYPIIDPFDSDFAGELVYWPRYDLSGTVAVYLTMAADLTAGTTEVKQATLEIGFEPVVFPTGTSWPPPD